MEDRRLGEVHVALVGVQYRLNPRLISTLCSLLFIVFDLLPFDLCPCTPVPAAHPQDTHQTTQFSLPHPFSASPSLTRCYSSIADVCQFYASHTSCLIAVKGRCTNSRSIDAAASYGMPPSVVSRARELEEGVRKRRSDDAEILRFASFHDDVMRRLVHGDAKAPHAE